MINQKHHFLVAFLLTVCSVVIITAAFSYYFIATPAGVRALVSYAMLQSARYGSVSIESTTGTFERGLTIKNIEIKNSPLLAGGVLMLQQMDVRIPPLDWRKAQVTLFNGRLNLPNCDLILFNGTYSDGMMRVKASGKAMDVAVIMKPFLLPEVMKYLRGEVSDANLVLSGPLTNPHIQGRFYINKIQYMDTIVREGWSNAQLSFAPASGQWRMNGPLVIENGLVNVHRSMIELQQSRAIFKGDPFNPALAIYGTAKADIYTIDLTILGTLTKPIVQVRSDPHLSDDMALMVLGMGDWAPSDFSLQYDNDVKRIGLRKKVSSDIKLGLELEQLPARAGQQPEYTKKLEGELAITDKFSFNIAEKLFSSRDVSTSLPSELDNRKQDESEFYLKYKSTF